MFIYHYCFSALAWFISILPFSIIYIISDILYFKLYYVFCYRKKVVFKNLRNSFPDKNEREIKSIAKKYYRNLSDVIIEVIKLKSISREQLEKRVNFKNYEVINELYKSKKSIIAAMGHCGNWEWMSMVLAMISKYKVLAVVKPLSDKFFERYITKLRTKFNPGSLIEFKKTFQTVIRNKDKLTLNIFVADQTPTKSEINYWTKFLNQDTPVFLGIEKIAKYLDFAVIYLDIKRVKRGFYQVEIIKITDNPKQSPQYEITEKHVHLLEESIIQNPDNWLWSHRRWKHKKN